MGKIGLIIRREFMTRVKKKSFIIMTILGPILMGSLFVIPILLSNVSEKTVKIEVVDETGYYSKKFPNDERLQFVISNRNIQEAEAKFKDEDYFAILQIQQLTGTNIPVLTMHHGQTQPSLSIMMTIQNTVVRELELLAGCDEKMLSSIKKGITVNTVKIGGEKTNAGLTSGVGYFCGFLIYFFIFLYGNQVMRGVIEEKTSRIIEVIISSVKPFQLMMGKIVGISLVGLTQFLLWVILTFAIYTGVNTFTKNQKMEKMSSEKVVSGPMGGMQQGANMDESSEFASSLAAGIESLPIKLIIVSFIFYFLAGYLLYGALFAAIGSAVDSDSDIQQFSLPITMPLILSIVMAPNVMMNPNGPIAVWLSMIPFTAPVTMMIRLPFGGVPLWQLGLSMMFLVIGFLATTLLAAKIYRIGILMYGKKVSYKEIAKWLRY